MRINARIQIASAMVSWYTSHSETTGGQRRWVFCRSHRLPIDGVVLCSLALDFDHRRGLQVPEQMGIAPFHLSPLPHPTPPRKSRGGPYRPSGTNSGWTLPGNDRFRLSSTRRGRSVLQLPWIRDRKLNPRAVPGDKYDRFNTLRLHAPV